MNQSAVIQEKQAVMPSISGHSGCSLTSGTIGKYREFPLCSTASGKAGGGWLAMATPVKIRLAQAAGRGRLQLVLDTGHSGWPDIEVGGPGFESFPVYRWDGKRYVPAS
jgi:hypothetical protein